MNYTTFEKKGITEKQHLVESYIDGLRSFYEIKCDMDLSDIKTSLLAVKDEEHFNDLLADLENAVKSYQDDEIIMIGEDDDE